MNDEAYEIYKRSVLGRDLSEEAHSGITGNSDSYKASRMGRLDTEYSKWESLSADDRKKKRIGPEHVNQGKDQSRWLKEMDAHAADPKRRAEMQYAAKHGLDYPIKKKPAQVKAKEMAVSKSAFGVDHDEEIIKWNPVSAAGKGIMAMRKPAAAGKHASVSIADRAGNIARNAPKPGQTSASQVAARKAAMTSPRANPVATAPRPPAATSTNVAPSAGTQQITLNNGNAGPTPKKGGGGKNGKGGGKNKGGAMDWIKANPWKAGGIGAGAAGGAGVLGYGAYKAGNN